jgi:serine/threonine protein phosphatase 1
MSKGDFLPADAVEWLRSLPVYHEDEHAIYVHAGLPREGGRWVHPSELADPHDVIWQRNEEFFRSYEGKRVVFGHTIAEELPQELSIRTPADPTDVYMAGDVVGVDTRCGHGGFLTAVELPGLAVHESRSVLGS